MGKRRRARECALQLLYQIDTARVGGEAGEEGAALADRALTDMRESFHTDDAKVLGYAETLVRGVLQNREAIDALIQRHSPNWKIERMGR
ncbi:MAG: N utilization substance protein B, partial [Deltaproteobacteria bacterium]